MQIIQWKKVKESLGFTLIELLIAIAIIGVLTAITVGALNPGFQLKKARDAKRKADLEQIRASLEEYRADTGKYPTKLNTSVNACGGNSWLSANGNTYLFPIPCDPLAPNWFDTSNSSSYYYTLNGTTYSLTACLENTTDTQGTGVSPGGGTGCTSNKYYTVVNP